jgi:hypothetical protein
MFASGEFRLVNIARFLEKSGIRTRLGCPRWDWGQVKSMLKNETYAGVRYFNRLTAATDAAKEAKRGVAASNAPTVRRLNPSCRHQLSRIAQRIATDYTRAAAKKRELGTSRWQVQETLLHAGKSAMAASGPDRQYAAPQQHSRYRHAGSASGEFVFVANDPLRARPQKRWCSAETCSSRNGSNRPAR